MKINEQIKETHEIFEGLGKWRFYKQCDVCDGPSCGACANIHGDLFVYPSKHDLAAKLDLITEAIVFAMRARRKEWRDKSKYNADTANFVGAYAIHTDGTYESRLALAYIRTLDLMGFYGVEFHQQKGFLPSELKGRDCQSLMRSVAYMVLKMLSWN